MYSKQLIETIKIALWENGRITVDQDTYEEMKRQAIVALPGTVLSLLNLSPELSKKWKQSIIQQIMYYTHYCNEQSCLPIEVPYVILKGTSAAQYYPHSEYRTMGDIDIMTRREDYNVAYQQLQNNGYRVIKTLEREVSFEKNGIVIELHRYFASLNNPEQAQFLDELIINNITTSHFLPDRVNGLVLLEHISQHLENGLGLRQIIDWMMCVDKCLSDKEWESFCPLVTQIGLEKLAIIVTHMCEMYLGLPERKWSQGVDEGTCKKLLDYILSCGDFGSKRISDSDISENVFAYASSPKTAFSLLQKQGLANWNRAKENKLLKPFAWIYQLFRYAFRGLRREQAVSKVIMEYKSAKERNAMFDALGVKTAAKGIAVYKNGIYTKR